MNQEFFQEFFNTGVEEINLTLLTVQLISTSLLCFIVSLFYIRYGQALSNRKALAKTFVLIGLTTMIIITIVKSSLALSLGLVGALSIVRFRTAIKEPEELAYFFIVISIGLGIGAEQILVTAIGTAAICTIIFSLHRNKIEDVSQNLVIRFKPNEKNDTESVLNQLKGHCTQMELRRLDENSEITELAVGVDFKNINTLLKAKNEMQKIFPDVSFSFLQRV